MAALYARERRGDDAFRDILRQFRRWSIDQSDEGPIYLGYRLGHIKGESRVFRALVYNKGALVLHMLRRLVGDEAFFAGVRRYYKEHRFTKAGTDDLRVGDGSRERAQSWRDSSSDGSSTRAFRGCATARRSARGGDGAPRADRRCVRPARHGDAAVRRWQGAGGGRGQLTEAVTEARIPVKGGPVLRRRRASTRTTRRTGRTSSARASCSTARTGRHRCEPSAAASVTSRRSP